MGEGSQYLPFVARSHEIWRELEAQTGQPLLYQPGLYLIAPKDASRTGGGHWDRFVERTAVIAQNANIPFEIRTPTAVRAHQPPILVDDRYNIGFEPTGGVVMCELAIETQLTLARQLGAAIHPNEPVLDVAFDAYTVTVTTAQNSYQAAKAVVAAGAWMSDFMPAQHKEQLSVTRQVVYWFEVEDPTLFFVDHFPGIIWQGEELADYAGVFPMIPDGLPGIKLLTEQFVETTDPHTVSRTVSAAEIETYYQTIISGKVAAITPNCIKATVCLYTNTPDDHFIIDYHPDSERVILASPCSGHGFKHSASLGEAMAQLALNGESKRDLSAFRLARFR